MFKNQLRVFLSQLALDKAISAANSSCSTTPIFVHPTLPGLSSSANYTIDVRSTTHSHHYTVEPFQVSVIEANTTSGSRISHNTSVAYFDFCRSINISLTLNNRPINWVEI
jgi:hypothetical protein